VVSVTEMKTVSNSERLKLSNCNDTLYGCVDSRYKILARLAMAGPITLVILFLVSHFNFLFIPHGRLNWLPVSFSLHVKYTLSYHMVSYNCQVDMLMDKQQRNY